MTTRVKMPRNGHRVKEAAKITGLSTATIIRWTSEPREDYLARADEKRRRVRELRSKGLSIRTIAQETGYSVGTVHRYIKQSQVA
ncbi:helix-turn-helix domain-containing protein [Corynebacterium rouxii]|uniref:helix-turn-helix domain-containing protein n=1 Tax=Corynebacterium rouxii TaxID=2719119 RepID=UPI00313C5285